MCDSGKTKKTLLEELKTLRSRAAELERIEAEHKKVEQKLKQYQFMVESAHDVIFFKDLKSRYVIANDKTLEAFGLSREQVIGKNDYEIMPKKAEAGKNIEDDKLVFKTGKPTEITKHMTGSDGKERWFQAIKVPQFDDKGNIIGLVGIARDITIFKRAEKEMTASEERFSGLAERSFDLIFMTDAQGHLTYISAASEKIFHYKPQEMVGTHFKNYLIKSEIPRVSQRFAENMQGRNLGILPMEAMRKDGSHVFVELNSSPILKDGETIGIQGIIRDITERKRAEEALKAERGRLYSLLDALPAFVYLQAPDYSVRFANRYFREHFGDPEGKPCYEVLWGAKEPCKPCPTFKVFETNKPQVWEWSQSPDGRIYEIWDYPFADVDGSPLVLELGVVITERKKAEEEIKRAAEEWDRTFNAIADLVFIVDKDFTITKMNKAFPEALKLKPEDIIGKKCYELLHKSDKPWPGCPFEKAKKDKEPCTQEVEDPNIGIPLLISTSPIFDDNGKLVGAVHIAKDITDRKNTEQSLRESEERLRVALSASQMGTWRWDPATNQDTRDASFNGILGLEAVESTQPVEDFLQRVHPEDRDMVDGEIQRTLREHCTYVAEFRIVRPDGTVRWLRDQGKPLYDEDDHILYLTGAVIDITERKRAEEALQKARDELEIRVEQRTADLARANVQLRSLASELSLAEERLRRRIAMDVHDHVGQNLAISKIKIESLRESATSPELAEDLEEIRDLIAQTIESTRSLTFELSPPVLYELGFEAAVEWLVRQTRQQYGLSADFKAEGQTKPLDNNVRVLLFQAVRELLVNVAKHAQAHNVTVSTRRVGNEIRVSVEDDGVGFDISQTGSHDYKTGGFGLFSIRERLGHIGGRLEVESRPGLGTRVTLTAPIDQDSQNSKEQRK